MLNKPTAAVGAFATYRRTGGSIVKTPLCPFHLTALAIRLSATISPDIRRMLTVMELDLSHNQLTGELIDSLWHMYSLAEVDLSYNNLTGTLSKALG